MLGDLLNAECPGCGSLYRDAALHQRFHDGLSMQWAAMAMLHEGAGWLAASPEMRANAVAAAERQNMLELAATLRELLPEEEER